MRTFAKDAFIIALFGLLALFCAVKAFGQPQAPPVVPMPPQAPPVKDRPLQYREGQQAAAKLNQPLVVFIGTPPRPIAGAVSCVAYFLPDYPPECIVVTERGGSTWRATLGVKANDSDIRRAAGLEVTPRAVPFRKLRLGEVPIADDSEDVAGRLAFLKDLVPYQSAKNTQTTFRRWSGVIVPSPRLSLENKWQVPGGLDGVHGWSSQLLKSKEAFASEFLVRQDPSDGSSAITWGRIYPDGTTFADVLRNESGVVFEVRVADKRDGIWERFTAYRNVNARPNGYVPVSSRQCRECHDAAGRSEYAGAAIPGADGVLSDPIDVIERGESVQGGFGTRLP